MIAKCEAGDKLARAASYLVRTPPIILLQPHSRPQSTKRSKSQASEKKGQEKYEIDSKRPSGSACGCGKPKQPKPPEITCDICLDDECKFCTIDAVIPSLDEGRLYKSVRDMMHVLTKRTVMFFKTLQEKLDKKGNQTKMG